MTNMLRVACTLVLEVGEEEAAAMIERAVFLSKEQAALAILAGNMKDHDNAVEWTAKWEECAAHVEHLALLTTADILAIKHRGEWPVDRSMVEHHDWMKKL